jgi:BON domain
MRRRTRNAVWFAGGIAAGTALGWLTAPRRGDWVRNQFRQKLRHWRNLGRIRLSKRGRDLENRLWGSLAAVRQAWTGHEHYVDANTLVDQVHTELGRQFGPTLSHVNLNAYGHTVYLHGYVESAAERDRLIAAIAAVDGVDAVASKELRIAAAPAAPRPINAAPPPAEHAVPPRRRARRP